MCNLYSLTKGQAAIRDWFRASNDRTGNLPLFPGIFPDQMAPIVRNGADGERELVMARWGMPGPLQFGGAPITNIRNVGSPHWRGWLGKQNRCIVPANLVLRVRRHAAAQDAEVVRPRPGPPLVCLRRSLDPLARRAGAKERASGWAA
jgi:putative SOS response-associated peptidase YedK